MNPTYSKKLFYKIGEVCKITNTEPYVLRYWETEFPFLAPQKNKSGQRIYKESDIEMVFMIKKLLYEDCYTIAGARKKLEQSLKEKKKPAKAEAKAGKKSSIKPSAQEAHLKGMLKKIKKELEDLLEIL